MLRSALMTVLALSISLEYMATANFVDRWLFGDGYENGHRVQRSAHPPGRTMFFVYPGRSSHSEKHTKSRMKRSADSPTMKRLHIETTVTARYGETEIQCTIQNDEGADKEAVSLLSHYLHADTYTCEMTLPHTTGLELAISQYCLRMHVWLKKFGQD